MKNMIRNLMLASAVVATAALATTSAMATTLNVPFSFTVNGKQCPAGVYSVERGINSSVVSVSNREGSRNFTWVLHPGDPDPTEKAVILHFENQGDTHVLQSVQYGSQVTSPFTKKSKRTEYPTMSIGAGEGR
jgi:hypothetical protein